MTIRTLFITIAGLLKMTNSQYYSQPASVYQPYSYYPSPTPSISSSMYATQPIPASYTPTMFTPPPMFTPPLATPSFTTSQTITSTLPASPALTFAPPTCAPMPTFVPTYAQTIAYPQPTYPPPVIAATPTKSSTYAPVPPIPLAYSLTTSAIPTASTFTSAPKGLGAPKCSPPTATAYYLTAPVKTPKTTAKTEIKENYNAVSSASPTYPCPFCTGFANVPKNSKIPPPPPSSSVLPGIFDKIPTITIPDELKIKDLSKIIKPSPLVSDLLERKLSEQNRFDQALLDGFLTVLGLDKMQ